MDIQNPGHSAVDTSLDWLGPSPHSDLEPHNSIRKERTSTLLTSLVWRYSSMRGSQSSTLNRVS
jgi:hypothetical protein